MDHQKVLRTFYPLLIHGDVDSLRRAFDGGPNVDTPTDGPIEDLDGLRTFIAKQGRWLRDQEVTLTRQGVVVTPTRLVEEQVLYLRTRKASDDLPVALVADIGEGGITALRIYHSSWRLTGGHSVRGPLLPPVDGLVLPQAVERYLAAMADGDIDGVTGLFEPDAYLREPSGDAFRHQGTTGLRAFFESVLSRGGGPKLRPCTVAVDGDHCALEIVCDAWGERSRPPQAGLLVFELADAAKIRALRAYDDIAPPEAEPAA